MKVILLQNVPRLGLKNEIKEVSEGYAINFLIPKKMAKFATVEAVNKVNTEKVIKTKKTELLHTKAHGLLNKINGKEVVIKTKANEKGHLFAQVHIKEIADAIGNLGVDISEDWIDLENPIKSIGEFPIPLEAYGKRVEILLKVVG
jgi:large subunit ribosomal protein L9